MAAASSKPKVRHFSRLPKGPNGGIQLMLIQNVEFLGKAGDVVEVKKGYANNFLLPEGLAIVATDHHKRMVEKHKVKLIELEKMRLADLRMLADKIGKQSINVEANATDEGHLYGSVGGLEIAAALKQLGLPVTEEQIKLAGPLRELGLYTVKVQLHADIVTDLKVWVVPTAAT
jgi:large subunit ribosomal protein L9